MNTAKLAHERTMIATQTEIESRQIKLSIAATKNNEEVAKRLAAE